MHRRFWRYSFDGETFLGATPTDDVTVDDVHAEWRALAAKTVLRRYPVATPLLEALHQVGDTEWDAYADSGALGVDAK